MKLPKKIRVGYIDYKVVEVPVHAKVEGDHSPRQRLIRIRTRGRSGQWVLNTTLHEICHAIFYTTGLQDAPGVAESEEMLVNMFANGLSQVLRDNPEIKKMLRLAR